MRRPVLVYRIDIPGVLDTMRRGWLTSEPPDSDDGTLVVVRDGAVLHPAARDPGLIVEIQFDQEIEALLARSEPRTSEDHRKIGEAAERRRTAVAQARDAGWTAF